MSLQKTRDNIQQLFEKIRNDSYLDYCSKTTLSFKWKMSLGYSSPFSNTVFINAEPVYKSGMHEDAIVGLLAHELAHQVSYGQRSFFKKWWWLRGYLWSANNKRRVEHEADMITIARGYGKQLYEERLFNETWRKKKPSKLWDVYLTSGEIDAYMKSKSINQLT